MTQSDAPAWDFVRLARKWQQRWFDKKAFEPTRTGPGGKEKFFFTVPYPYVSGLLHVGHGRTYTNGDVIARFHRMQGKNVLWPMAFHITGTPVLAISAKIKSGDLATIKMFEEHVSIYEPEPEKAKSIVQSFSEPWNVVNYFSTKLILDFTSMGYSLDLSRQFTTGDPEYNKFIEWQFRVYKDKGYLLQASYPILYCTRDRNAVGEDDIQDGDSNPVEVQTFTALKFKLENDSAYIVSSTLRPETVFGITNEFVNPAATYVRITLTRPDGSFKEEWIVSKQAAAKLGQQNFSVNIVEEFSGEHFVGRYCTDPMGRRVPILPASFVDPNNATGFVHSVPAHAPYDYVAIEQLKADEHTLSRFSKVHLKEAVNAIVPISIISLEGFGPFPAQDIVQRMGITTTKDEKRLEKATKELYREEFYHGTLKDNAGGFKGLSVTEGKDKVIEWLKKNGKAADFFEASRPALCRCGGEVIAAVMPDQWFIDFAAPGWKERARVCLEKMFVYPPTYRKQFEDVFDWLNKRPAARRRGLGTQLPFNNEWIIESLSDSTIYMAFYTVIKAIRNAKLSPQQLSRDFFDYVFLGIGEPQTVSLSIGSTPAILEEIRSEFLYWYPNDVRHTGIAHITNHLSFFIFAHSAIFPPEHWPKAISLNELVISEGTKMSKSKGNVVLLNHVANRIGPDVFRLYAVGGADFSGLLDYRAKDVDVAAKNLSKFASTVRSLQEARSAPALPPTPSDALSTSASDWMLSKFERAIEESTKALSEFRLRDYVQLSLYGLLNDFDYFSRRASAHEKVLVARELADRWVQLLSPVVPHVCEELWEFCGHHDFASLSPWPKAVAGRINPALEAQEDLVKSVAGDARKIHGLLRGKKLTGLTIIVASGKKKEALLSSLTSATAEQAAGMFSDEHMRTHLLKNFFSLQSNRDALEHIDEFIVLSAAKDFLSSELHLQVTVEKEERSQNPKAGRALPGKPALDLH